MRDGTVMVPRDTTVMRVPPFPEILEEARMRFEMYEQTVDRLTARIKELEADLEDETYADAEMARMREEVEESRQAMRRGFPISTDEWEAIRDWERKHLQEAHGVDPEDNPFYGGAIGGTWKFAFTPTSIGVIGEVSCHCGEKMTFRELG